MKFIIVILLFISTSTIFALAKPPQKIKFHKPETEAEKALDVILRVESGLIKNSTLKHEDMFTEGFDRDYKKIEDEVLNSEECKKWGECDVIHSVYDANPITCSNDNPTFGYEFYISYQDAKKAIISNIWSYEDHYRNNETYSKSITESIKFPYIMKKEGGKWKIDGVCGCNINCPTPAI